MPVELILLASLATALIAARPLARRYVALRRVRLRRQAVPATWHTVLALRLPLYRRLPQTLRARLLADMQVFLAEKRFYGQDGLVVTDAMRLIIAAQACLLTLNQSTRYYPGFTSIILYPDTYVATETAHDGLLESTHDHVRAGESWYRGPLVLSWRDIAEDLAHGDDARNVVLHEFAHKLDEQDGLMDGAPALARGQAASWTSVFRREYERLGTALDRGEEPLLDPYAATAPAEFFAVTVETFFEQSAALQHHHPELYTELENFFGFDPAGWPRVPAPGRERSPSRPRRWRPRPPHHPH
ncbi:MAG: M90 family metallopeptidase [Gammaproteobacteria bacterium]